jgi:TorA maturation chaperone TorD
MERERLGNFKHMNIFKRRLAKELQINKKALLTFIEANLLPKLYKFLNKCQNKKKKSSNSKIKMKN